jgi:ubiquinone/menaquinone biosynthesis C-methylase UbiE
VIAEAGPAQYDRDYYLRLCGGFDLYQKSGGTTLDSLRRYALRLSNLTPGMRLLDDGCGRGELVLAAARAGAVAVGVDFSPDAVALTAEALARAGLPVSGAQRMDACRLGFADDSFDVALMTDVVEHLLPDRLQEALLEVHRVLRPGGRLVVHTTPSKEFLRTGQHIWRLMCRLGGRAVPPVLTEETELHYARHCNLQSARSLDATLSVFRQRRVWHAFTYQDGSLPKRLAEVSGVTPFLTRNLWAVCVK